MKYFWWLVAGATWALFISLSFLWNYNIARNHQTNVAFQTSRNIFKLLVVTRKWNTDHRSVYVPVSKSTPPNQYLNVPKRDIKIDENLTLTQVNPAYMTRQLSEIAEKTEGVMFRITGRNPLQPKNKPTPLEEMALETFDAGESEFGRFIEKGGGYDFFYMAPVFKKPACNKCHSGQGIKTNDLIGGISVVQTKIERFSWESLLFTHSIIGLLGFAILMFSWRRSSRLYQIIEEQAVTDYLTNIPNRRAFMSNLNQEIARCSREKHPLSLIMLDVDYFKKYNDAYGHSAGDSCLHDLAQALSRSLRRQGDFCCRYGGEEFAALLPNTDNKGAIIIAEAIIRNIELIKIPHAGSDVSRFVTVSLGIATTKAALGAVKGDLVNNADIALYRAKENGRNRLEIYTEESPKKR